MADTHLEAKEFFTNELLDSIERNFNFNKIHVIFYDPQGNFLSWRDRKGIELNHKKHFYKEFVNHNVIRQKIYQEAIKDKMTYFSVEPRIYMSTDCIKEDYDQSEYVQFLENNFKEHYSATMAFGINAYIEVLFLKNIEEGDFTKEEQKLLQQIQVFLANGYKTYKKHEHAKIVSSIQQMIIAQGESAYLIVDDFLHVMNYNKKALVYLQDILGEGIVQQMGYEYTNNWLNLILGIEDEASSKTSVRQRIIKDYIFKIYTHDMHYSNTIIDRYYWITLSKKEKVKKVITYCKHSHLTMTEQKVAHLMGQGLTYNAIADELVVSYHTIKKHVQNIYLKCGVKSRYELYQYLKGKEE